MAWDSRWIGFIAGLGLLVSACGGPGTIPPPALPDVDANQPDAAAGGTITIPNFGECGPGRPCPPFQTCQHGACVNLELPAPCVSECDAEGRRECSGRASYHICTRTGPNCLIWIRDLPCPPGLGCDPADHGCRSDNQLPTGASCLTNSQCQSGVCLNWQGGMVCSSPCNANAECPGGLFCIPIHQDSDGDGAPDRFASRCVPPNREGAPVGGECSSDTGCESGLCAPAFDTRRNTCAVSCRNDNDCPLNAICVDAVMELPHRNGVARLPWRGCLGLATERCEITNRGVELCDGKDNDCDGRNDEGGVCEAAALHVIDAGVVALPGTGVSSGELEFELPEGTTSAVVVLDQLRGGRGWLTSLVTPEGVDLIADRSVVSVPLPETAATLVPSNPEVILTPGIHRIRVANYGRPAWGTVQVIAKTGPVSDRVKLNLNIWFVGAPGLNATLAQVDGDFQSLLGVLRKFWESHGVDIDAVDYLDIPPPMAERYSVIQTSDDRGPELAELFKLSRDSPNPYLNLFLVRELIGGPSGFTVLGVSGGIPGPAVRHGTAASGVAISMEGYGDWRKHIRELSYTIAHETGHYFGLFHTTEATGSVFEPLADTPSCPRSRDANNDGYLSPTECAPYDGGNLMFWLANTGGGLSPLQRKLIHRSPSTR